MAHPHATPRSLDHSLVRRSGVMPTVMTRTCAASSRRRARTAARAPGVRGRPVALCMLVACVAVVVEAGNASARECFDGKTPCEDAAPAYPEGAFRTFYLSF